MHVHAWKWRCRDDPAHCVGDQSKGFLCGPPDLLLGPGHRTGSGRTGEHRHTGWSQDPDELAHVAGAEIRGHVLQHDVAVDEVEGLVCEHGQVWAGVDNVLTTPSVPVEPGRALNHRRCDVDTDAGLEVVAERLGEPSDATAKVEGAALRRGHAENLEFLQHLIDLVPPCGKELIHVPQVSLVMIVGEHGKKRILVSPRGPVARNPSQRLVHARPSHSGRDDVATIRFDSRGSRSFCWSPDNALGGVHHRVVPDLDAHATRPSAASRGHSKRIGALSVVRPRVDGPCETSRPSSGPTPNAAPTSPTPAVP